MKNLSFTRSFLASGAAFLLFPLFLCCFEIQAQESGETNEADIGGEPWVLDIAEATVENSNYRVAKWTGEHMQMVLMSLHPGENIDLEKHDDLDQFIRVEQGEAQVLMGKEEDDLTFDATVLDDWAVFIPAGHYHKIRNTGNTELKLYTIYAPAAHPENLRNRTYKDAKEYEEAHEGQ